MTGDEVLAERTHQYSGAPRAVIFRALTTHRARWLDLHPGEVLPSIVEAIANERVVWSSFWPASPEDTIAILLTEDRGTTTLRFRWHTTKPPDARGVGFTRQRLNTKFGGDIRGWLATDEAWQEPIEPAT